MNALLILICSAVVLGVVGRWYSKFLASHVDEDSSRATPAITKADGRDYIPTPTPVVFAHHFASIAGAGPIVGPVIAIIFGWLPAVLWVLVGGLFFGGVHDYLATYMATRHGGESIAMIAKRLLGKKVFVALMMFLVLMLALVCAAFLNLSAAALTSMLPFDRIELPESQTFFRVVNGQVVIGGIASMSVIFITAVAPLMGWLYIKKQVAVWKCSILAILICGASITFGLFHPVSFPAEFSFLGIGFTANSIWITLISIYVLLAAGVPVWIFLQSRDFINVHILYVGMVGLFVTLIVAGFRGGVGVDDPISAINIAEGEAAMNGSFWPMMFIVIACGAVSGFHSLCAGGTTSKQIRSEQAARYVGYYGMLLESFLAICVIAAMMIGASKMNYIADVHPSLLGIDARSNPVLGFAMAIGGAFKHAFGLPVAIGALAGMILLEGFLVTTLDTAIRLMRYLLEEIWRTLFENFDVFADSEKAKATSGVVRVILKTIRYYWFNSGLAVAIMLLLALSGGGKALWGIFATSNQLLAAFVLLLASLWLLRKGQKIWFILIPALALFVTTFASLLLLLKKYSADPSKFAALLVTDIIIILVAIYLVVYGVIGAISELKVTREKAEK